MVYFIYRVYPYIWGIIFLMETYPLGVIIIFNGFIKHLCV